MKHILSSLLIALFFTSCTNDQPPTIDLPEKPVSTEAAFRFVEGKTFATTQVATLSPFAMDNKNPYEWMDEKKDSSKFSRDYLEERMEFSMQFINDTSIILNDDRKTINGTFKIDNEISENEKEGIKLRVSYPDSSMSFPGMSGPVIMTSTFLIVGADEKNLLLETPRSYNNRKVVVLMQAK